MTRQEYLTLKAEHNYLEDMKYLSQEYSNEQENEDMEDYYNKKYPTQEE
jgi:hypothetical protein